MDASFCRGGLVLFHRSIGRTPAQDTYAVEGAAVTYVRGRCNWRPKSNGLVGKQKRAEKARSLDQVLLCLDEHLILGDAHAVFR
jgi:hypothetical protein